MEGRQTSAKVQACEQILDSRFNDFTLCWEALQVAGSGVRRAGGRNIDKGNQRMAVLGDTVLKAALCEKWWASNESKGIYRALTLPDFDILIEPKGTGAT